jgi:soluble lytic murein transglycosylase-like protein
VVRVSGIRLSAGAVLLVVGATAAPAQIVVDSQPDASLAALESVPDPQLRSKTFLLQLEILGRAPRPSATSSRGLPKPFDTLIGEHAAINALRPELVRAVVQAESAFNPSARSPKGAIGLMQLMPDTARQLGASNPFDPEQNIRAGTAYLRQLLDRYGTEALALAAYNAGPQAVDRYGRNIPPYAETRQYVAKVNEIAASAIPIPAAGAPIYKVTEAIDGREIVTYTNRPPR